MANTWSSNVPTPNKQKGMREMIGPIEERKVSRKAWQKLKLPSPKYEGCPVYLSMSGRKFKSYEMAKDSACEKAITYVQQVTNTIISDLSYDRLLETCKFRPGKVF